MNSGTVPFQKLPLQTKDEPRHRSSGSELQLKANSSAHTTRKTYSFCITERNTCRHNQPYNEFPRYFLFSPFVSRFSLSPLQSHPKEGGSFLAFILTSMAL